MKRTYNTNVAFLDLLFNTLLCFAALFVVAFVLVNPVSDEGKVDVHADFLITISWPEDVTDDIDTYIQDPQGNVIYFGNKETSLIHLDRDDLGGNHDAVQTEFGIIEYKENREIVTIRKVMPGEYVLNLHMYSKRVPEPAMVTVQIDKMNPFSTVLLETITLERRGQEETVCRITLNSNGDVISISNLEKDLVRKVGERPWSMSRWD